MRWAWRCTFCWAWIQAPVHVHAYWQKPEKPNDHWIMTEVGKFKPLETFDIPAPPKDQWQWVPKSDLSEWVRK